MFGHPKASIAGRKFTSGEKIQSGSRCGSVVTSVVGGRSRYGVVTQFIRVVCPCCEINDFAIISWLPPPSYPDGDPLTVRIDITDVDINNIGTSDCISLRDIQPSRVLIELDSSHMYVMRMEGLDTLPINP